MSFIAATSASMWTGAFRPTGPAKPVGAPVTSRTAASVASSKSPAPSAFLSLISLTWRSPRTMTAIGLPSAR